jgi:predicted DNA-binding transcriptional regulator AlpA
MTTISLDNLMTRDEIAAKLKVTRAYLDVAASRGEGPPMLRIGRIVRYDPAQVAEWLAVQTYQSPRKRAA